ncbi:MAG: hypothetical protein ABI895_12055 [Deltaproteobacteria bacterium]
MKILRVCFCTLSALALGLALGSCGKVADGDTSLLDSNTNWLMRCTEDQQCSGALRCYCGICTKPCGQNSECGLLDGAECAESGERLCGEQAGAGGLCVLACTDDANCGSGFNCRSGQCAPKPCATAPNRSWDDVYQSINADLARSDVEDTPYLRYFELGNSSGDEDSGGACGLELSVKRQALTKLINSLSIDASVENPTAVNVNERLYRIDLRDFAWDRPISIAGQEYADGWEALIASDPYALSFIGDDAEDARADTGTLVPVLLVDSFIAAATEPEVYYGFVDIEQGDGNSDRLNEYLENELGIVLEEPPAVEAGFVDDGVEFLAQQREIEVRAGYAWVISDFGREPGALFANPLRPALGEHELLFTLPNGLNAFAFFGTSGQRLDTWSVTTDAEEADGRARAPRSNWRRHPQRPILRDEVRDQVDAHTEQFSASDLELIRRQFPGPEQLALRLAGDYYRYTGQALTRGEVNPELPEPISRAFAEFSGPVTLELAAAELLVTRDDLTENLALLDAPFSRLANGTMERVVFTALYAQAACVLDAVLENQPNRCP